MTAVCKMIAQFCSTFFNFIWLRSAGTALDRSKCVKELSAQCHEGMWEILTPRAKKLKSQRNNAEQKLCYHFETAGMVGTMETNRHNSGMDDETIVHSRPFDRRYKGRTITLAFFCLQTCSKIVIVDTCYSHGISAEYQLSAD